MPGLGVIADTKAGSGLPLVLHAAQNPISMRLPGAFGDVVRACRQQTTARDRAPSRTQSASA